MHYKIKKLEEEFDNLSFDVSRNGDVVVCDHQNNVETPLIEMTEPEWLANLPAIRVVLDWWVNEAGGVHRWALDSDGYNNKSFDLPTIYMNRDNMHEMTVQDLFIEEFKAWFELRHMNAYWESVLISIINKDGAIEWLKKGNYSPNNIDDVESFDDIYFTARDVEEFYTWADIPLDNCVGDDMTELEERE